MPLNEENGASDRAEDHAAASTIAAPADPQFDEGQAREFLDYLFPGEAVFGFQSIMPKKGKHAGDLDLTRFKVGTLEDCAEFLREKTENGAGVYFALNKLPPNAKNRREPSFVDTLGVVSLDLDDSTPDALKASDFLLPHARVETSPGRNHFHWRVNGLELRSDTDCTAGEIIERLARCFGGDASIADIPRVLRLPGGVNRNHGVGAPTRVNWSPIWSEGPYELEAFLAALEKAEEAAGLPPWAKTAGKRRTASAAAPAPVRAYLDIETLIEALWLLENNDWVDDYRDWLKVATVFAVLSGGDTEIAAAMEEWSRDADTNAVPDVFAKAARGGWDMTPGKAGQILSDWLLEHSVLDEDADDNFEMRARELAQLIPAAVDQEVARETIAAAFADDDDDEESVAGRRQTRADRVRKAVDARKDRASMDEGQEFADEAPRPLRRPMAPAAPYPVEALGELLGGAVKGIADIVQCPEAIAANSILAVASLAVQGHVNVEHPATERHVATSLHLVTVVGSGARKSEADRMACDAIAAREAELRKEYTEDYANYQTRRDAYEASRAAAKRGKGTRQQREEAIRALGPAPVEPIHPTLTTDDPTIEGLMMEYGRSGPSLGIFNNEAGAFVGGHGLTPENKLKTLAGLSRLWDGQVIKRTRADKEKALHLEGRRLAMHLMLQPEASRALLADPIALDQGITARLLVCAPQSIEGTRFQRPPQPESRPAIQRCTQALLELLRERIMTKLGTQTPEHCVIPLDAEARDCWLALTDEIESKLGPGGELEPVKSFANKLPENILRIAAILTIVENGFQFDEEGDAMQPISLKTIQRATTIGRHYLDEALRLFDAGQVSPEIVRAEKLLYWLRTSWNEDKIGLRVIYNKGPRSIRAIKSAQEAVAVLEQHGWLVKLREKGQIVDGKPVREAWRIVREE